MNLHDAIATTLRCPHDRAPLSLRNPPDRLPTWRCPTCLRSWRLAEETLTLTSRSLEQERATTWDGAPVSTLAYRAEDLTDAPEVSIVLPALNEADSLPALVERIERSLRCDNVEIVFVDDGSDDATWSRIRALISSRPGWQGLRLARRFGHQAALLAGLRAARGRAVISMDSDGQHPPELLAEMIERWRNGARVVQAVRAPEGFESAIKRVTSDGFYRLFSTICDAPIRRGTADFRLLDRLVVDAILESANPAPFLRGLVPWLGFETKFISYEPSARIAGQTKYSLRRMLRLAAHGLFSFSVFPLRIATWIGLALGALALMDFAYILTIAWTDPAAVPGWASTTGLIALLGAVQLFTIGMLGEYVGRTYMAVLHRPPYVVSETACRGGSPAARHPQESARMALTA